MSLSLDQNQEKDQYLIETFIQVLWWVMTVKIVNRNRFRWHNFLRIDTFSWTLTKVLNISQTTSLQDKKWTSMEIFRLLIVVVNAIFANSKINSKCKMNNFVSKPCNPIKTAIKCIYMSLQKEIRIILNLNHKFHTPSQLLQCPTHSIQIITLLITNKIQVWLVDKVWFNNNILTSSHRLFQITHTSKFHHQLIQQVTQSAI